MREDLGAFEGLGAALRWLVDRSGQPHKQVAAKAGVSESAFSRFLSGELNPRLPVLGKILRDGLGMTVLDLAEALYRSDESAQTGQSISLQDLQDGVRTLMLRFQLQASEDEEPSDGEPLAPSPPSK
jgi:transcriptional regulator with XRE-family HTH domain